MLRTALLAVLVVYFLAGCGSTMGPVDSGTPDAGTMMMADGGVDRFAGNWLLTGSLTAGSQTYTLAFPLTLTRGSDGNYRGTHANCTIPYEVVNESTLRSVDTSCTFSAADLTEVTYQGTKGPQFGASITQRFAAGGEIRVVADALSANGTVTDSRFPTSPLTYSYMGSRP